MIISHRYRFIFLKTVKTAGTSIEVMLSRHCDERDVVTPIYPHVEPHVPRNYSGVWNPLPELVQNGVRGAPRLLKDLVKRNKFYNHIRGRDLRHRISTTTWNEYFKFCVERNPWDKTLSHYHMIRDRLGGNLTLDAYLARGEFCTDLDKYTDRDGRVIVDEVILYEQLVDALGAILPRLGIPFDGTLGVTAKAEHRKDKRPYREILTRAQGDIVARAFAREIAMYGYEF